MGLGGSKENDMAFDETLIEVAIVDEEPLLVSAKFTREGLLELCPLGDPRDGFGTDPADPDNRDYGWAAYWPTEEEISEVASRLLGRRVRLRFVDGGDDSSGESLYHEARE